MPWIFIGIAILLIGGGGLLAWQAERRRRERWAAAAERLGLHFVAKPGGDVPLPDFKLFGRGHGRRLRNAALGTLDGATLMLADYQYTTSSGKNSSTHRQTITVLQSPTLRLPSCFLRTRVAGFDTLGRWFGGQDINFEEDPAFSKGFVLQGPDEAAIRERFNPALRSFFLERRKQGFQFEAAEGRILFHFSRRARPEALDELIEDARALLRALGGPAAA